MTLAIVGGDTSCAFRTEAVKQRQNNNVRVRIIGCRFLGLLNNEWVAQCYDDVTPIITLSLSGDAHINQTLMYRAVWSTWRFRPKSVARRMLRLGDSTVTGMRWCSKR